MENSLLPFELIINIVKLDIRLMFLCRFVRDKILENPNSFLLEAKNYSNMSIDFLRGIFMSYRLKQHEIIITLKSEYIYIIMNAYSNSPIIYEYYYGRGPSHCIFSNENEMMTDFEDDRIIATESEKISIKHIRTFLGVNLLDCFREFDDTQHLNNMIKFYNKILTINENYDKFLQETKNDDEKLFDPKLLDNYIGIENTMFIITEDIFGNLTSRYSDVLQSIKNKLNNPLAKYILDINKKNVIFD